MADLVDNTGMNCTTDHCLMFSGDASSGASERRGALNTREMLVVAVQAVEACQGAEMKGSSRRWLTANPNRPINESLRPLSANWRTL